MKVINRIMISSALLVALSLITLITVIFGLFILFPGDPGKEILDEDIFYAEEILDGFDVSTRDWGGLNSSLSAHHYSLLVLKNNNIVYSGLDASQDGIISSLKAMEHKQGKLAGRVGDLTFTMLLTDNHSIFAIENESNDANAPSDLDELGIFLLYSLPFCLIVITVILIFSQIFTRIMAGRILRPLNDLSEGAKRIENGDLSKPIIYNGSDEFFSVCNAFNHMQEHLLKEREKNTAYEKARRDLVAGISHDLRTPLTSVKGYIKGLMDGVANTPEKREQYLTIAYEKACFMDVLLQRLFDFSKLETGNLSLFPKIEDLAGFVHRFTEDIHDELAHKNIEITVEATSDKHPVEIDTEQMHRVLLNLTENAIRYANVDPLILKISVWRESGMEHLLFADNGQGVLEENLSCLFERFWRSDEARGTKNGEGSGLGLYIVKFIIEKHGGFVNAKNDDGLNIEIVLPCAKEDKHEQNTDC